MSRRPRKPGNGPKSSDLERVLAEFRDNREALLAMLAELDAGRQSAEEARRAKAGQWLLSEALRQAAGPTVVVDPQGVITHVNNAAGELLGYGTAELVGTPVTRLAVPDAPPESSPEAVVAHARTGSAWRGEVLRRHRDGTSVPLYLATAPILDARGDLLGIVGSYTDLRPFKESEARIEALRRAIEELATESDIERMGARALEAALALSGADMGAIALREAGSHRLCYRWVAGLGARSDRPDLRAPFEPGQGVGGAAYRSGRTVFIPDYQHFSAAIPAYVELGVTQAISVPVCTRGESVGALSIGAIAGTLTADDIPMVEAIGRQLSAALERDALLQELRESERRFRRVVDNVPDILFTLSLPELAPTFVSPAVTALLGYDAGEFTADPGLWLRIVHDADRDAVAAALASSTESGDPLRLEVRFRHKDGGTVRWFQGNAVFELRDGGSGTAFGVLTDITERRDAEQSLRESEERLKVLFEHAPDGIYLVDGAGRFVDGNLAAETIVGRARGTIIGRTIGESGIVPPDQVARVSEMFARQLRGERLGPMETELLHAEGRRVPVEVHAFPVRIAGQKLLMGIARDVTERKATERRYEQLFESMLDGVAVHELITDARGHAVDSRFLAVNAAFERDLGLPREQIVGQRFRDLFPDGDRKWIEILAPVALEGTQARFERYAPDLGRYYEIAAFSPERGQLVTVQRDVSERVESEAKLERLNRALRTMSAGNEALVHADDEQTLLDAVCAVLTDVGGYALAWAGYKQDDADHSVAVMAAAGAGRAYLDGLDVGWGDDARGQGPTGTAIRSGDVQIEQDLRVSARFRPWREAAARAGLSSSIGLPLRAGDELIGTINIYAREAAAFSDDEIALLQELAADVSYGIQAQRVKARHEQAVERLRESEQRFRTLFDNANDGILVVDPASTQFVEANERICEMLGYAKDELLRLRVADIHPAEDLGRARGALDRHRRGMLEVAANIPVLRADGSVFYADISGSPVEFAGNKYVVGVFRDVSDRHLAEAERMVAGERLQNALVQTITAVARTIEKRDPYTSGHQQRVAELAAAIARGMGLDEDRIQGLSLGSLIHDIGKIYVPAEILNRPGRLSAAEFEMIKSHPQVGYDIIRDVEFPWPVADMVLQHHERLDGSGYPDGLRGEEICVEARILAVADVVEAMSSHRPYRAGLGVAEAIAEIRSGRGRRYDADAVDACLELLEEKDFHFSVPVQS